MSAAQHFMANLRDALVHGHRVALRVLYRDFGEMLRDRRFDDANACIDAMTDGDLPIAILLGGLTATNMWREEIPARVRMGQRVREMVADEPDAEAYTVGLL